MNFYFLMTLQNEMYMKNERIGVEFIIKNMYSEYVYHVCYKMRMGIIWNNDCTWDVSSEWNNILLN